MMPQLIFHQDVAQLMTPASAVVETCQPTPSTGVSSVSSFGSGFTVASVLNVRSFSGGWEYSLMSLPEARPAALREISELQDADPLDDDVAPNDVAIVRAARFAAKALKGRLPAPVVMRLPEGGVMLRYRRAALFVSVEAFNDGEFIVALSGAAVPTQISNPDSDDAALATIAAYLQ